MTEQAKPFDQAAAAFIQQAESDADQQKYADARKAGALALEQMLPKGASQAQINETLAAALIALTHRTQQTSEHSTAVAQTAGVAIRALHERLLKLEAAGNPPTNSQP